MTWVFQRSTCLGCCSFPMTVATRVEVLRDAPWEAPGLQTWSFLPPLGSSSPVSRRDLGPVPPASWVNPLVFFWFNGNKKPKMARWESRLPVQQNRCSVSFGGSTPFLGAKTCKPAERKVPGTGSESSVHFFLGVIVTGHAYFCPFLFHTVYYDLGGDATI